MTHYLPLHLAGVIPGALLMRSGWLRGKLAVLISDKR